MRTFFFNFQGIGTEIIVTANDNNNAPRSVMIYSNTEQSTL